MAVVNVLYDVGARDEDPERTGFAHLFEHLMFGGSKYAPNYDEPLQNAGGESNAFTNNDVTNYYNTLPAANIETAFWLESDRMLQLNIDKNSLEVQRKVVCEEFKEHYLNQPYGDVWHQICGLAYKQHPYQWPTIGRDLSHVEDATLHDVKAFFDKFYKPNNAILVVSGPIKAAVIHQMAEKWFGDIPAGELLTRSIIKEPTQLEKRSIEVERDVPIDAIYKAYHMDKRDSNGYYTLDLATDVLSSGSSARLYRKLVKEQKLFSELDAYVTGTLDEGLVIVEGKLAKGTNMKQAEEMIDSELDTMLKEGIDDEEFQKVKNKQEAYTEFSEVNMLNRTINLAFCELMGDTNRINTELERYNKITTHELLEESKKVFRQENSSTIHYYAKQV